MFTLRNSLEQLQAGRIDLHGLHVEEARQCLLELLPLYQRAKISPVIIITGSGMDSFGYFSHRYDLFCNFFLCISLCVLLSTCVCISVVSVSGGACVGHHTLGPQQGKARLYPVMYELCSNELGLTVRQIKDDNGFYGALSVDLLAYS